MAMQIPREERGTISAYDPANGNLIWQQYISGQVQAGVLVTGGDLIFVGTDAGFFHAFDATNGQELFRFFAGNRVHAAPMTYQVNGTQYVTVAAGDIFLTFTVQAQ